MGVPEIEMVQHRPSNPTVLIWSMPGAKTGRVLCTRSGGCRMRCTMLLQSTRIWKVYSLKPHGRTTANFYACCLWPRLSCPLTALRYVKYFRFCGCHIFISWSQWARIKHGVTFRGNSPDGSTSWTSDNYSVLFIRWRLWGEICYLRLLS